MLALNSIKIRALMEDSNVTVAELSRRTGQDYKFLHQHVVKTNKPADVRLSTADKIASALEVAPNDILTTTKLDQRKSVKVTDGRRK